MWQTSCKTGVLWQKKIWENSDVVLEIYRKDVWCGKSSLKTDTRKTYFVRLSHKRNLTSFPFSEKLKTNEIVNVVSFRQYYLHVHVSFQCHRVRLQSDVLLEVDSMYYQWLLLTPYSFNTCCVFKSHLFVMLNDPLLSHNQCFPAQFCRCLHETRQLNSMW